MAREDHQPRRLYGRRQNRPLNKARQEALDELLPVLGIELPVIPVQNKTTSSSGSSEGSIPLSHENGKIDYPNKSGNDDSYIKEYQIPPTTLFPTPPRKTFLEIGFGNGEHVAAMMQAQPENGFIACEPFVNGMAAFLKDIREDPDLRQDDAASYNVRVWMDDAILVVDTLTDSSIDGIYVLNPDPWPKARHHKRRIISQDNLDRFARILKPGGLLTMTTDVDDLAEWMVTEASNHPAFEWTAENAADWQTAPEGWLPTRYETKGIKAGRKQSYLLFQKCDESR